MSQYIEQEVVDKKWGEIIVAGAGILLLLALAVIFLPSTSAALINNNSIGANSETYEANFKNLTINFFDPVFNITQTFTGGSCGAGNTCLWVPWYSSSSFCNVTYLKDYGSISPGTPNMTVNVMVTDELSEIGLLISQGDNQTRFDQFYNTIVAIRSQGAGSLPIWVVSRNGTRINSESGTNDTASDASARIGMAMYLASNNTLFSNTTAKANYLSLANSMAADHLTYETKVQCFSSSISSRQVCRWIGGGRDVASNFDSSPYMYTGYFTDAIKFMYMAYKITGNNAYASAAENYTEQYLMAANYTGGTSAVNFRVSPFNFNWNMTFNPPRIQNITNVNHYYFEYDHPQWDDSDAPRALGMCDVLRVVNLTNPLTGVYQNLSDYCNAFSKTDTFTPTTSCLQYYFNGTCYPGTLQGNFYYVGLGGQMHTYYNTSIFETKVDQALSQYSWSQKTYNSDACYGIYRGIRPAKLLAEGLGKDEGAFGSPPLLLISDPSGIQINLISPQNNSWIASVSALLQVLLTNNNNTNVVTNTTDPTPFLYYNFTWDTTNEAWTGSFENISGADGYMNVTGNSLSPSLNLSKYTSFQYIIKGRLGTSANNLKIYFQTPVGTFAGSRWFFENTSTCGYNLKYDEDFNPQISNIGCDSNFTIVLDVNRTARQSRINITWTNGTALNSTVTAWAGFTAGGNTSINENGTGIEVTGSSIKNDFRVYNWQVWNTGANVTNFISNPGNGSMNISFFNAANNALIGTINNVPDGGSPSVNWTGLSDGPHIWYVNVTSKDNRVQSSTVKFSTDTVYPQPDIIYPVEGEEYDEEVTNMNFTIGEANPNLCFYSLDQGLTNVSVTCGNNVTGLSSNLGTNIWTVYVQDLAGNLNSTSVSFVVSHTSDATFDCSLLDVRCILVNELIGSVLLTMILAVIVFAIIATKLRFGFETTITLLVPIILSLGVILAGFSILYGFITFVAGLILAMAFLRLWGNK